MNIPTIHHRQSRGLGAFSLIELMISSTIGLVITGSVVMLLFYSSREQVRGISNASVEEMAYVVQNNLTETIRTMSTQNPMMPDMSTACYDTNGNLLGYNAIYTYSQATGSLVRSYIYFDPVSNNVVFIPNMANSNNMVYWATNSKHATVRNLYFNNGYNLDGSQNHALVDVFLQVDDSGYATNNYYATPMTNDPSSIFRTFSVLMKSY